MSVRTCGVLGSKLRWYVVGSPATRLGASPPLLLQVWRARGTAIGSCRSPCQREACPSETSLHNTSLHPISRLWSTLAPSVTMISK